MWVGLILVGNRALHTPRLKALYDTPILSQVLVRLLAKPFGKDVSVSFLSMFDSQCWLHMGEDP